MMAKIVGQASYECLVFQFKSRCGDKNVEGDTLWCTEGEFKVWLGEVLMELILLSDSKCFWSLLDEFVFRTSYDVPMYAEFVRTLYCKMRMVKGEPQGSISMFDLRTPLLVLPEDEDSTVISCLSITKMILEKATSSTPASFRSTPEFLDLLSSVQLFFSEFRDSTSPYFP